MQFQNEDGLTFSCKPLDKCHFDLTNNKEMFAAVVCLDYDNYAVFSYNDCLKCIRSARNFTSKFKLTTKVYAIDLDVNGQYRYIERFKYTYEDCLRYMNRNKG